MRRASNRPRFAAGGVPRYLLTTSCVLTAACVSRGEERLIYVLQYLLIGACVLVTNQFSALFFPESCYDLLVLTSIDIHAYLLFVEMPGNLDGASLPSVTSVNTLTAAASAI